MKKCSNCFLLKPESDFYPKRYAGKTYLQSRCKGCGAEVCRAYKLRKSGREFILEREINGESHNRGVNT